MDERLLAVVREDVSVVLGNLRKADQRRGGKLALTWTRL